MSKTIERKRLQVLEEIHDKLLRFVERSKKRNEDTSNLDKALDALEDEMMLRELEINPDQEE
jgi:hypothetical protein